MTASFTSAEMRLSGISHTYKTLSQDFHALHTLDAVFYGFICFAIVVVALVRTDSNLVRGFSTKTAK
jgi:hypothetical protein